jgi:hypothetical protein
MACNTYCYYVKNFINKFEDPLFANLSSDFSKFFAELPTDGRTCYNKSLRHWYTFEKINITNEIHQDILGIYGSKLERQHRRINYIYQDIVRDEDRNVAEAWPVANYSIFDCDKHYLEFWIGKKDNTVVVFLEMLISHGLATVRATMGHADHLKFGIMKSIILHFIKNHPELKYLHYGEYKYTLNDTRVHFMNDLNIVNHNQCQLLKSESLR